MAAGLGRASETWTAGDHPGALLASCPDLDPARGPHESNRLVAEDAGGVTAALRRDLAQRFGERGDRGASVGVQPRLFDASPRNALRVPLLDAVFGDATFVYVARDPRRAISEALSLWESGEAVTYPDLPGWTGPPWSLLLVPGWQELRGCELAEIVTEQWVRAAQTLLDDLESLAPDRWCVTEFEALLADPVTEARRLFGFLDLHWHPGFAAPLVGMAQARGAAAPAPVRDELRPFLDRAEEPARRAAEWIAPRVE